MGWLTLCKKDPLLELIRGRLGTCNLLRRPIVDLEPLDVFLLLEDGWFAPPQLVRVGPLRDLLARGTTLAPSVVRIGQASDIEATQSGAVQQSLAFKLLECFGDVAGIPKPETGHTYSGKDELTARFLGVTQSSANLTLVNQRGHALKLNLRDLAVATQQRGAASLLLVDTVLYASGMQLDCVQNRRPSYSIRLGANASAGWQAHQENAFQAQGTFEKLAFAFSCVRLVISEHDGSFHFAAGPRAQVLAPNTDADNVERVRVWPEEIACTMQGSPDDDEVAPQISGLSPTPAIRQVQWPSASMAPAWDAGTTDIWSGTKLVGLAFGAMVNAAISEDTLTDEAESGYRSSRNNSGQSARDSQHGSGHGFDSRADFQARAWSCLEFSEGERALYQRARNVASRYPKSGTATACAALVKKIGNPDEVVRLNGVQALNTMAKSSGLVFFGPLKAAGPGEATRKIWQVVPDSMGLPPTQAVSIESVSNPVEPGKLLQELVAKLDDEDRLVIVECDCIVRLIQHSWQLRNAELP